MIPQKVHYVWVGGTPKTELVSRCLESWKKYLPGYEIIEWNENNFPLNDHPFAMQAYAAKKWAFVSDVIRSNVLYKYGGIYLDTDLELVRSPELYLDNKTVLGYENRFLLAGHFLASEPHSSIFHQLCTQYQQDSFVVGDSFNEKTVTRRLTEIVVEHLHKKSLLNNNYKFSDLSIYKSDYFTGNSENMTTVAIHHFRGSWKNAIQLTKGQWFVLRAKLKVLNWLASMRGNLKTLEKDDMLWENARKLSKKNVEKGKKIFIELN